MQSRTRRRTKATVLQTNLRHIIVGSHDYLQSSDYMDLAR